jgi:hypothetical protein
MKSYFARCYSNLWTVLAVMAFMAQPLLFIVLFNWLGLAWLLFGIALYLWSGLLEPKSKPKTHILPPSNQSSIYGSESHPFRPVRGSCPSCDAPQTDYCYPGCRAIDLGDPN